MKILVDSDAIFAFYIKNDPNHEKAINLYQKIQNEEHQVFITNLVLYEVATLISYRIDQKRAIEVAKALLKTNMTQIFIDGILGKETFQLFFKQTKKRTSFIDCANVIAAEKLAIPKIFSFDKFYKDKLFS